MSFNDEFFELDWRKNRPAKFGLAGNDDLTIEKHRYLLTEEVVKGKRILDVGSFMSQTGDWCLNLGAKHYTGIEINEQFANDGKQLMQKYHPNGNWNIITSSLEDYFSNSIEKFDIVYCWGVLFSLADHNWFINELTKRGDHIFLLGKHPKCMWYDNHHEISDELWHELEYNIPYQEWQVDQMTQTAQKNGSVYCTSVNTSLKAVKLLMEMNGFNSDEESYEHFKKVLPNDFGLFREKNKQGFFVVDCKKDEDIKKPTLFNNVINDKELWDKNYVSWK